MADIIIHKALNEIDLAYGKNILSLYDLDGTVGMKYVVTVKDLNNNIIAQLKQAPNLAGYGHFDLQNIFKNQISSTPTLESTPILSTAEQEVFSFNVHCGYETAAEFVEGDVINSGSVINGRKPHYEINWDDTKYRPEVGSFVVGGITQLYFNFSNYQRALTDRHIDSVKYAQITDGKPSWAFLTNDPDIYKITKSRSDSYTLTWLNDYKLTDDPSYNTLAPFTNGINGFYVAAFEGDTELTPTDNVILNIALNGGGPDINVGDDIQPTENFLGISLQVSELNSSLSLYPTATHYYVAPFYWSRDPGSFTQKRIVGNVYRFDLEEGECNDFDPIEISWINSYGFRDYFTFQKRNDFSVTTEQNTYQQLDSSWSGPDIEVFPYNRGERVFNKSQIENYSANTRYLSDAESQYLKNLYISPDIKVKFDGESDWIPVIITDTQYTERTFRKDRLFQHTINFRLANPQQIQRG